LSERIGQRFTKRLLTVGKRSDGSDRTHEFDAVSTDGRIVAGIKSSSGKTSGGNFPSGKVASAYQELFFLSLADAENRILVLTNPDFYEIMRNHTDGCLSGGLKLLLIPLAPDLLERANAAQQEASQEMSQG
jgi:hypothetical protein